MSNDDENVTPPAPAAGKSKMLPMLLVINTLLIAGVLVFLVKRPSAHAAPEGAPKSEHGEEGEGAPAKEDPAAGVGPTLRLDNFTVQLKSTDVDRYAHLSIEVEMTDEAAKAAVEKRVPPVRDAILSYLSDRTAEELRGSEGLKVIKEALIKRLDEIVPGHRVRALYVTDFIIQ
jgi:flagellar FliL protein